MNKLELRALIVFVACAIAGSFATRLALAETPASLQSDVVMKALTDELDRSMKDLVLEGLPRPYFMQFNAEDRVLWTMSASYGGVTRTDDSRTRTIRTRTRVGSPAMDNTNVGGSFGGRGQLPLEDDYTAIRHAAWQATDGDYKRAVETLARKEAYLKEKTVEDRPDDFSPAEPVTHVDPSVSFTLDANAWEQNLRTISAQFKKHPQIQDARVDFLAGAALRWILNSEGTRVRLGDSGALLQIRAEVQAAEGMRLGDELAYLVEYVDEFPPIDKIVAEVDALCGKLLAIKEAPVVEHYVGPVWFDAPAAARVFDAMLSDGLASRPQPLGAGDNERSLEKKIGARILPRSFQVHDDPREKRFENKLLAGYYEYDDEGVRVDRVNLVENGVLKTLLAGRAPTKKIKRTTGHGRSGGFADPSASVGCLYIEDRNAVSEEELKKELLDAARDEGLEFAVRIAAIEPGARGDLGDPIETYKVNVADGKEELVRGMKFLPMDSRSLKRILAAGKQRAVYNSVGGTTYSVISPSVVFEELELTKIDEEFDKLPILQSPTVRRAASK